MQKIMKRFIGSALIQLPVGNSYKNKYALSPFNSVLWFIGSAVIQSIIAIYYISDIEECIILIICTVLTLYFKRKSENGFYMVILLFICIIFLSFYCREYFISYINNF